MSDYTESLGLELVTPGTQSGLWGTTTNNNLTNVDQAISGITPISFAGAGGTVYTLTSNNGAADEARSAVLNVTGAATATNTIVIPNKQKLYVVRNDTGQSIIFKTLTGTVTYTVPAGYYTMVFCNGNNEVYTGILVPGATTLGVNGGGTGATAFTAGFVVSPGGTLSLTTQPAVGIGGTATNQVIGQLPVGNGGTGQTSFTSGALLTGNGSGNLGNVPVGTAGQGLISTGSSWASANTVNTISGGTGISITGSAGNFTISASGSGSVTTVTASSPLASTGGSNPNISLSGVISTANGGTGASSLSAAGIAQLSGASFSGSVSTTGAFTSTAAGGYAALQSNAIGIGTASNTISSTGSGNVFNFNVAGTQAAALSSNQFVPSPDNTLSLGSGGLRWTTVYATTGTINTSDRNDKQQIADLTAAEKAVGQALKGMMKSFKFNDSVQKKGADARVHFGVIAQDVQAAFEAQGLNANNYGVFCSDTLPDGTVRLGVRYEELFSLILGSI